jgi:hypothetical protein
MKDMKKSGFVLFETLTRWASLRGLEKKSNPVSSWLHGGSALDLIF